MLRDQKYGFMYTECQTSYINLTKLTINLIINLIIYTESRTRVIGMMTPDTCLHCIISSTNSNLTNIVTEMSLELKSSNDMFGTFKKKKRCVYILKILLLCCYRELLNLYTNESLAARSGYLVHAVFP